jgi:hypothetical protein
MAAYTWPTTLPQETLANGFTESLVVNTVSTPMDNGPAKTRRRSARPTPIQCSFLMTGAQVEILRDFIVNTLFCVRRFNWKHPRTGAAIEVKIVPANGGEYYSLSPRGADLWNVVMDMEILP